MPVVKIKAVLRMLSDDGSVLAATRGSHRQFVHATKPGRVTVAGKDSDDLAPGTFGLYLEASKTEGALTCVMLLL